MKRLKIFHDEVWLILRQSLSVNQLGGSWGVLLREILNLRSSEIVRKDVFFYLFCIFKVFEESTQVSRKGVLCPRL